MSSEVFAVRWNTHSETILNLLNDIKNSETFSDGLVLCDGKFFPIHKLILSSCSDHFKKIFDLTGDKSTVVVLNDITTEIFEALLSYMYDGKVDVTKEKIPELIKSATALKIKGLAVSAENSTTEEEAGSEDGSMECSVAEAAATETDTCKMNPFDKEEDDAENGNEEKLKIEEESNHEKYEQSSKDSSSSNESANEYPSNSEIETEMLNHDIGSTDKKPDLESILPIISSNNAHVSIQESMESNSDEAMPGVSNIPFNDPLAITCVLAKWGATVNDENLRSKLTETINLVYKGNISEIHPDILSLLTLHFAAESNNVQQLIAQHMKSPEKDPYSCPYCDYKTGSKQYITQHIRRHTGEKPYACTLCDYKATQRQSVTYHMRTHTGERPFPCPHCKYSSSSRQNLERHIRRHTGETPFGCPYCNYRSITKIPVVEHMKVRHPNQSSDKSLVLKLSVK